MGTATKRKYGSDLGRNPFRREPVPVPGVGSTCEERRGADSRSAGLLLAATTVDVLAIIGGDRLIRLEKRSCGYHGASSKGVEPGTQYVYCLDRKKDRPDPASSFQPAGVHGPSQVVDPRAFRWSDANWRGLSLDDYIIYEIHVGTFTPEGSFDAILSHLEDIRKSG